MATLAYFSIPKILDTDPRYEGLSIHAKYLYGRMRDTRKLSVKNRWQDKLGVYIKLTRQTMATLLKISLPTLRKVLGELVSAGLIIDVRKGLTQCNHIYVQLLPMETEEDVPSGEKEGMPPAKKQGFIPDRNGFAGSKRNPTNPDHTNSDYRPRWGQKTVLAQQYTQRDYTREELSQLIEII